MRSDVPKLSELAELEGQIKALLADLKSMDAAGRTLAAKVKDFETGPLSAAETELKTAVTEAREECDRLSRIVAGQPRAKLNKLNSTRFGWVGVSDAERRQLEEAAALVTPEEARLNDYKARRVRLSSERLDELEGVFSPLWKAGKELQADLKSALDELDELAYKLHIEVHSLCVNQRAAFYTPNVEGVSSRLDHVRNGSAVVEGGGYQR